MSKRLLIARLGRRGILLNISRGEIWLVNLDPTVGAEIRKTRPVVVVSSQSSVQLWSVGRMAAPELAEEVCGEAVG
jgi:hypothetical protein